MTPHTNSPCDVAPAGPGLDLASAIVGFRRASEAFAALTQAASTTLVSVRRLWLDALKDEHRRSLIQHALILARANGDAERALGDALWTERPVLLHEVRLRTRWYMAGRLGTDGPSGMFAAMGAVASTRLAMDWTDEETLRLQDAINAAWWEGYRARHPLGEPFR